MSNDGANHTAQSLDRGVVTVVGRLPADLLAALDQAMRLHLGLLS